MNTSTAKHNITCDACNASLGEMYPNNHNNISIHLPDIAKASDGEKSVSSYGTAHHFCDEACMTAHLNKRAKLKAKATKVAKASEIDSNGILVLNIPLSKKV